MVNLIITSKKKIKCNNLVLKKKKLRDWSLSTSRTLTGSISQTVGLPKFVAFNMLIYIQNIWKSGNHTFSFFATSILYLHVYNSIFYLKHVKWAIINITYLEDKSKSVELLDTWQVWHNLLIKLYSLISICMIASFCINAFFKYCTNWVVSLWICMIQPITEDTYLKESPLKPINNDVLLFIIF